MTGAQTMTTTIEGTAILVQIEMTDPPDYSMTEMSPGHTRLKVDRTPQFEAILLMPGDDGLEITAEAASLPEVLEALALGLRRQALDDQSSSVREFLAG